MARRIDGSSARSKVSEQQVIPTGLGLAFGSVVVVAAALAAGAVPTSSAAVRLGISAAFLAAFAAFPITAAAAAGSGVLAFLTFDGFLVNSLGELSWHGATDGWRLLTIAVAVISGFVAGVAYRAVHRWLQWQRWRLWITDERWHADEKPAHPTGSDLRTTDLTHG